MEKIKTLTMLHLIHKLSLLFTVGNLFILLFFVSSHEGNHYGGLFIWSLVMSGLALLVKEKTKYYPGLLIPWILLPLILEVPLYQIGYLGFLGTFILTLLYKNSEEPKYDLVEFEFGVGIAVAGGLMFFTLITGGLRIFNNVSAGYLLIYILSGVLMLRSLRYLQYSGEGEKLKKINFRAIGIILILSITLSTQIFMNLFQQLRTLLWMTYNAMIDVILWVFYWPLHYFGVFLNEVFRIIVEWISRMDGVQEEGPAAVSGEIEIIRKSFERGALEDNTLFRTALGIAVIALIFYVLYKMYIRKGMTRGISETYTEKKEVILPNNNRNLWKTVKDRLKPKSKEERIRMYYQGFLQRLREEGVILLPSDTTGDFQRKGEPYFDEKELTVFRHIYLQARYGEKAIDSETFKVAKNTYNKLMTKEE